jgi:2-polyprenyl-3-methyl-5-hydroxy-6-metoxy-1,4-benzoquinol methylase
MNVTYAGEELTLFREAVNWKKYISGLIRPYITGKVAEVGAGIGSFTPWMYHDNDLDWNWIEPDEQHARVLQKINFEPGLRNPKLIHGTLQEMPLSEKFETIIYLDVLEHIHDDKKEVEEIIRRLKPRGHVIILVPAFQMLFSAFDKAIGHHRRYNKQQLTSLFAGKEGILTCKYLDTAGFFASTANRYILKQEYPTQRQVQTWDRMLVPVSRILDKLLLHAFGKSLLLIWEKNN